MSAISCREVVEIVTDYLDGVLAPDVRAALDEHLSGCDACRAYIAQVRTTTRLAGLTRELEERPDRDALLAVFREFKRGA